MSQTCRQNLARLLLSCLSGTSCWQKQGSPPGSHRSIEESAVRDAPNDWRLGKQNHRGTGKSCRPDHPAQYTRHLSSQFPFSPTACYIELLCLIQDGVAACEWLILVIARGKHDPAAGNGMNVCQGSSKNTVFMQVDFGMFLLGNDCLDELMETPVARSSCVLASSENRPARTGHWRKERREDGPWCFGGLNWAHKRDVSV
jgi:hypothetical protein